MMNHARLDQALQTVAQERGHQFNEAFRAASQLVAEWGESNLAERILTAAPVSVPWEVVADLLGILEWSTQDNGAAIRQQADRWLVEAKDLRRVQVALNLDTYPFASLAQMSAVLAEVATHHPEVASQCAQLVHQRRAQRAE
jgi:hypothetical protein